MGRGQILSAMVCATTGLASVLQLKSQNELIHGERALLGGRSHFHSNFMPWLNVLQEDEDLMACLALSNIRRELWWVGTTGLGTSSPVLYIDGTNLQLWL